MLTHRKTITSLSSMNILMWQMNINWDICHKRNRN